TKVRKLYVQTHRQSFLRRVFVEQFIRQIPDWKANRDFLPIICRFGDFVFDFFELKPYLFVDLIVMRLGMPYFEGLGTWTI
ncbi:hypothetical protein PENTCL1PPCAC_3683, partial [Pristionchus entomophagus]